MAKLHLAAFSTRMLVLDSQNICVKTIFLNLLKLWKLKQFAEGVHWAQHFHYNNLRFCKSGSIDIVFTLIVNGDCSGTVVPLAARL